MKKTRKGYMVLQLDTHASIVIERDGKSQTSRVPINCHAGQIGAIPVFETRFAAKRLDPTGEFTQPVIVTTEIPARTRKKKD